MDTSLVVALVGVGGTITGVALTLAGQMLGDTRQRRAADSARFHADRRSVYSDFLAHLSIRRKYASDLSTYWDTPYFEAVRNSAPDEGEWFREAQRLMAEIHLLGDEKVISAATNLLMTSMAAPLIMFAPSAPHPTREQVRDRAASGEKLFKDAYEPCLLAMRASLHIAPVDHMYVV